MCPLVAQAESTFALKDTRTLERGRSRAGGTLVRHVTFEGLGSGEGFKHKSAD